MNLKGDHILNALEIINNGPPNIYIISTFCDEENLREKMNNIGRPFSEYEARNIFK